MSCKSSSRISTVRSYRSAFSYIRSQEIRFANQVSSAYKSPHHTHSFDDRGVIAGRTDVKSDLWEPHHVFPEISTNCRADHCFGASTMTINLYEGNGDGGRPTLSGSLQDRLLMGFGLHLVFKIFAVLLFASLLQKAIFKKEKRKLFPGWGALEIALASYVVSHGGLGRQI